MIQKVSQSSFSGEEKKRIFFHEHFILLIVLFFWFFLYVMGGATTYQGADSAEFLTIAYNWGVAHPPGFPLYSMLSGLSIRLFPFFSVPQSLSILASFITVMTLLGLYKVMFSLTKDQQTSILTVCVGGVSLHIWQQATQPEVFALLGVFAIWLSYFALQASEKGAIYQKRLYYWYAYAFMTGLASAHHQTIILTFPIGLYLLFSLFWGAHNLSRFLILKSILIAFFLFVVGFFPYFYIMLQEFPKVGSWGEFHGFSDLWGHFLRREFGTLNSGIYQNQQSIWFHSIRYLKDVFLPQKTFPWGLSLFWLIGSFYILKSFISLFLSKKLDSSKNNYNYRFLLVIFITWVISGFLFPLFLRMNTQPLGQYIVARFFLLPDIFLSLIAGWGIFNILQKFHQKQRFLIFVGLLFFIGITTSYQYHKGSHHHKNWLENYGKALLKELPPHALLLENGDDATCFGIIYLQEVLHIRKDVRFVCIPHLSRRWYVRNLKKRWKEFRYQWRDKHISSLRLIAHYRRLGRPVHVTTLYNRSIQRFFYWMPFGLSWQMLAKGQQPPTPREIQKRLSQRYKRLPKQRQFPDPLEDPWGTFILKRYTYPWYALANIFKQMHQLKRVRYCLKQAYLWESKKVK